MTEELQLLLLEFKISHLLIITFYLSMTIKTNQKFDFAQDINETLKSDLQKVGYRKESENNF